MNNDIKEQTTILVVDDTEANIDMILAILKSYDVIPATSGEDALSLLDEEKVDLILLDILMPEMDGFEVCQKLKDNPATKDIPVIFITAKEDEDSIEKAYEIGGVDYITKPFRPRELLARIKTHLRLQHTRKLLKEKNETQMELLHVLCHDLTNPLGAIESYSGLLMEYPDGLEEFVNLIMESAKNANNIIDLTRNVIAAEEKNINTESINLKRIIKQSMSILKMKLDSKNIIMEIDIPEDLEVLAEEISLCSTIINNLITNSIKFSTPDSVIQIFTGRKDKKEIDIIIKDYGIGIPKNLLKELFDLSKNINRIGTSGEQGTGFGMPLVKKFMERYGGKINVKSRCILEFPDNHGTEVCLTFKTNESF